MKKIMYMAVAAIAVLSSCSSEEFTQSSNGNNGITKVFTGTIESDGVGSRTTLADGETGYKKVNWDSGDEVTINGQTYTATPQSDATKATFSTTSQTEISSPYQAAFQLVETVSGDNTTFSLPASYTYSAGKYNMPMYAKSTTTELSFQNICGVLAIKVTSAQIKTVKRITVSSTNAVSGTCTISETEGKYTANANSTAEADKTVTLNCETAVTLDATGTVFYLPVPAGSHTLTVAVDDGVTKKYMSTSSAVEVKRNKIYNLAFDAIHSEPCYVVIGGLKWATANLGATTIAGSASTAYGDYYAWGEVATYYSELDGTGTESTTAGTWNTAADNKSTHIPGAKSSHDWANYCGNDATEFTEWTPTAPFDATSKNLTSDYDVAHKTLGGTWRMPTSADYNTLCTACGISGTSQSSYTAIINNTTAVEKGKGVYYLSVAECTVNGVKYNVAGTLFIASDTDKSQCVFFPAAGCIKGTNFYHNAGTHGYYWSSSLYTSTTSYAYYLEFNVSYVLPQNNMERWRGFTVRPVSE